MLVDQSVDTVGRKAAAALLAECAGAVEAVPVVGIQGRCTHTATANCKEVPALPKRGRGAARYSVRLVQNGFATLEARTETSLQVAFQGRHQGPIPLVGDLLEAAQRLVLQNGNHDDAVVLSVRHEDGGAVHGDSFWIVQLDIVVGGCHPMALRARADDLLHRTLHDPRPQRQEAGHGVRLLYIDQRAGCTPRCLRHRQLRRVVQLRLVVPGTRRRQALTQATYHSGNDV
mmetsp:Transcript_110885/g.264520  ORF Transcript_110885/g.264520 Transcript_110885/m.264520 type:complete len:230 (+) Transcript_110885:1011-1700(+)